MFSSCDSTYRHGRCCTRIGPRCKISIANRLSSWDEGWRLRTWPQGTPWWGQSPAEAFLCLCGSFYCVPRRWVNGLLVRGCWFLPPFRRPSHYEHEVLSRAQIGPSGAIKAFLSTTKPKYRNRLSDKCSGAKTGSRTQIHSRKSIYHYQQLPPLSGTPNPTATHLLDPAEQST